MPINAGRKMKDALLMPPKNSILVTAATSNKTLHLHITYRKLPKEILRGFFLHLMVSVRLGMMRWLNHDLKMTTANEV